MNPLNRLRITQRLSLGFGLTLALLLALLAVALLQVRSLNADLMRYDVKVVPAVKTIHTVLELIGAARRLETQHLLTADAAGLADLEQKLGRDRSAVAANLQAYRNLIADEEDRADYEQLQSLADRYWQQQDQVLALSRNKAGDLAQGAAAVKLLLADSRVAYYALNDATAAWSQHVEQVGNVVAIGAQRNYRHAVVTLCALAAGALLLGAACAFWISRSITRPLRRALDLARAVTHGDLTQQVEVTAHDEVGELLVSLNDMSAQLSALVADVSQASQAVHLAAREIAQGTDALSTRTQARAANLQETAASVEQITSAGKKNAAHAADADQIARGAHELAEDGGRVVAQAVSAMGAINGCSTKISDIIVVINDIAFQTNLLALNAAVEAARAGQQGRGFAVVASEVRALALRSAEAAKQIKDLINDSVDKVQAGTELVDRSGQTLAKIVSAVGQMTRLIGGIATASQEQASGVSRVNDAILQLDDATQQDAALVEQASAATRNLQEQAEALTQRTAHFGAAAGAAAAAERDASPAYGAPYARAA